MAAPTDSVEISALTAGAALDGTEILPMVQGGATVRNPLSAALTYFNANASLAAARITSGQLALDRGGTGADLSATGGANQIVRQNSAGGVFTVSALAAADIPNLDASKITTGTLAVARGGTGIASYTIGDLIYASGATTLAVLAGVATGNVLLSGGVATAPVWGKVDVTAHITGIVPSANGGTGINNAGRTLTISTNSGTLAFGAAASTLTIPATGTAALLAVANVFTAIQEVDNNNIGTTSTDGLIIANATAAAAGAQQYSPRLRLTGQGWKTNATAASQTVDFILENQPVQSTVSPKPSLIFSSQANAGGYLPLVHIVADTTSAPGATDTAVFLHSSGGNRGLFLRGAMGLSVAGSGTNTAPTTDGGVFISTGVTGVRLRNSWLYTWAGGTDPGSTADTGLARNAAAVVEVNNGTAGQWGALKAGTRDAGTTTITDGLTLDHLSTGTPAAGFGSAIQINLNSSTTAAQNAVRLTAEWVVATHASRTARYKLNVYDTASREVLRGEASGSAPMIGFLGSAAQLQQASGANLTNNVASGGTDDTIADFTDLTVYATDAATIRNDIYQLARKLKQVNDALRLYGLLT